MPKYACAEQNNLGCRRGNNCPPLFMDMQESPKIMLISQAPSRAASEMAVLADRLNPTFKQICNVLGVGDVEFKKNVFWTHYAKCYPGAATGGDVVPNMVCAKRYLLNEHEIACERDIKAVVCIGRMASLFIYNNIVRSTDEEKIVKLEYIKNKMREKNGIQYCFINHVAATANWAKDSNSEDFIKNELRPTVKELLWRD